ncbi:MAG: hypothetical protein ACE149_16620 [Armatimonadota bacterium]
MERAESASLSDEEIRAMQRQRFQQRVERVLEVMRRERVDWRGLPFIGADGRIGVRVVPIELPAGREEAQT